MKEVVDTVSLFVLRPPCLPYRRRVTSQRCSLEFLEDAVGCAPVQRYMSTHPCSKTLRSADTDLWGPREGAGKTRVAQFLTLQNQTCIWITKTQRPEEDPLHQEHEAV
jgi:hypothetical protein